MRSGDTLWNQIVRHYDEGVADVRAMRTTWASIRGRIDNERFREVERNLATQEQEAQWWRDASVAYFQSISKRPLPAGAAPPQRPLSYYEGLRFTNVPGTPH